MVGNFVFQHKLVASKTVVADKAGPLLLFLFEQIQDKPHEHPVGNRERGRLHALELFLARHVVLWVHRRFDLLLCEVGVDMAKEAIVLALRSDFMHRTVLAKVKAYITAEFEIVVDDQGGFPKRVFVVEIH